MFAVTSYTVEKIKDPFGILTGDRYEFLLELDVPDDDELYSEEGIKLRVIFRIEEEKGSIAKYEFLEGPSDRYLDLDMEEDELEYVAAFCKEHAGESEDN